MSQNHMMNGLTPHLFAAGMAAVVVAFPTPSQLLQSVFPTRTVQEASFKDRTLPGKVTAASFEGTYASLRRELSLCKSTLERGNSVYAEECRAAIVRGKAALSIPERSTVDAALVSLLETTEMMYCRVAWQQSIQLFDGDFDTATCLTTLPKLATTEL